MKAYTVDSAWQILATDLAPADGEYGAIAIDLDTGAQITVGGGLRHLRAGEGKRLRCTVTGQSIPLQPTDIGLLCDCPLHRGRRFELRLTREIPGVTEVTLGEAETPA